MAPAAGKDKNQGGIEEVELRLPSRLWRDVHLCRRRLERSIDALWAPPAEMALIYITLASLDDARIAAMEQVEDLPF